MFSRAMFLVVSQSNESILVGNLTNLNTVCLIYTSYRRQPLTFSCFFEEVDDDDDGDRHTT